jgi:hypothetical protein
MKLLMMDVLVTMLQRSKVATCNEGANNDTIACNDNAACNNVTYYNCAVICIFRCATLCVNMYLFWLSLSVRYNSYVSHARRISVGCVY